MVWGQQALSLDIKFGLSRVEFNHAFPTVINISHLSLYIFNWGSQNLARIAKC